MTQPAPNVSHEKDKPGSCGDKTQAANEKGQGDKMKQGDGSCGTTKTGGCG